ncbi:citrulline utilization hydrolase CtlX [Thalassotalea euphylliae]|uniref:citrulline utilization hydrolase CtlX n=1 Tax=Thalassotalea euphylliae TaxID=1655234 RepID=UPI00363D7B0D
MTKQAPNTVVMVRPHHFHPNPQTLADNSFQSSDYTADTKQQARSAYAEVTEVARVLTNRGVTVELFEDETTITPDSVFPNNWFSTHDSGQILLYPMYAQNRRLERRHDIVQTLKTHYGFKGVVDLSYFEHDAMYLEGTGALVLDHDKKLAYVALSNRAHKKPVHEFCELMGFDAVYFAAHNKNNVAVYHTNVMMAVTSDFVFLADAMIFNKSERNQVLNTIDRSGKKLVPLSEEQINRFAGNVLELDGKNGRFIAMSTSAFDALTQEQKRLIQTHVDIAHINIPTVELAGGSLRCMLAGIHLPPIEPTEK